MKKLMYATIALVAFSDVSMANTVAEKTEKKEYIVTKLSLKLLVQKFGVEQEFGHVTKDIHWMLQLVWHGSLGRLV